MKRAWILGLLVTFVTIATVLADGPGHCDESSCPTGCSLHGICASGQCFCESGWTGDDCDVRSCGDECGTPEQVAGMTEFTIDNFTTTRAGWNSFCAGQSGDGCRCAKGWGGSAEDGCRELRCAQGYDGFSGSCCTRTGLCFDPATSSYSEFDVEESDPELYVDLVPVWPSDATTEISEIDVDNCSCALREGCLLSTGKRRLLRFPAFILNDGTADLFVGVPGESDSMNFAYDTCHGHAHSSHTASYSLLAGDETVVTSHKQGFCFMDIRRDHGVRPPLYDCDFQGISAGWMDVYGKHLDCQWIDITGVPGGDYTLVIELNPTRTITERTYSNNVLEVPITLDAVPTAQASSSGTSGTTATSGTSGTTATTATTAMNATTATTGTTATTAPATTGALGTTARATSGTTGRAETRTTGTTGRDVTTAEPPVTTSDPKNETTTGEEVTKKKTNTSLGAVSTAARVCLPAFALGSLLVLVAVAGNV